MSLYPCGRPLKNFSGVLKLVILGATGSIGRQTLEIVRANPERIEVVAVSCHRQVDLLARELADLARACPGASRPLVAVTDPTARDQAVLGDLFPGQLLGPGPAALLDAIQAPPDVQVVVNGLVGSLGLEPTLVAARRGVRIALANKESLVVGGPLVRQEVFAHGAELLPVDSEHSAIAQCLSGHPEEEVQRLLLTASGGPFRETPAADLARVTLAEVLKHPTWSMGAKVTVDSASLMNKGLEVIEAHHLFGVPYDRIDVLVHPGSYVHSLVEFVDGALLAQLGAPDMRLPIQYAISGEKHWPLSGRRLDLIEVGRLVFEKPDLTRFPCLDMALGAGRAGGSATIVLNAANEVAVAALLQEQISFGDLPRVIAEVLDSEGVQPVGSLAEALEYDRRARRSAVAITQRFAKRKL